MNDKARFWMATMGLPLWSSYPFAFWFGPVVARNARCAGRAFTGRFDDCFSDYLPVLEMMAFPLTLLLLFPFLRFAFALYVPNERPSGWRWWLAGRHGGAGCFPGLQMAAGAMIVWVVLHAMVLPLAWAAASLWIYWTFWIAWPLLGILASWPKP